MGTLKLSCLNSASPARKASKNGHLSAVWKDEQGLADAERVQVSSGALKGWRAPNPYSFTVHHRSGTTVGLGKQGWRADEENVTRPLGGNL